MIDPTSTITPEAAPRFPVDVPPYGIIARRIKEEKVVSFLGAAASRSVRSPGNATFNPQHPDFLPFGNELALALADEAEFPSQNEFDRTDLAKVSSYFEEMSDRGDLRKRLRDLLHPEDPAAPGVSRHQPSALHTLLASIPEPQIIVTTNYDTLLEQAFEAAARPYHLVIYPAESDDVNGILVRRAGETSLTPYESNKLDLKSDLHGATVLYKLHGSIYPQDRSQDNFVITEDDYVKFLSCMITKDAIPHSFCNEFAKRSFLFLGYGLRDWNLRVLLKELRKYPLNSSNDNRVNAPREGERPRHWAIQLNPSLLERKLWASRQVNIFDVTLENFVAELATHIRR